MSRRPLEANQFDVHSDGSSITVICTACSTTVSEDWSLPADLGRMAGDAEVHDQHHRLESLTPREGEVLAQLREGIRVRDIARLNVVSEGTVRTQVRSILAKLGVTSQLEAVGLAHNVGWIAPPPHDDEPEDRP